MFLETLSVTYCSKTHISYIHTQVTFHTGWAFLHLLLWAEYSCNSLYIIYYSEYHTNSLCTRDRLRNNIRHINMSTHVYMHTRIRLNWLNVYWRGGTTAQRKRLNKTNKKLETLTLCVEFSSSFFLELDFFISPHFKINLQQQVLSSPTLYLH